MALAGLLANLLMSGSQTNEETGKKNWATGQFWGNMGKSLIPMGGGQMMGQQGNQATMAQAQMKECPDPNGIHGPGIMMNLTNMYGKPMWLCPSCGYREGA